MGRASSAFKCFVTLTQTPQIGLVIREPNGSSHDLEAIRQQLTSAVCTPILHIKTPTAMRWLHHHPNWGIHLSASDDAVAMRPLVKGLLGQSTHNLAEVQRAFEAGVDYVTLSPVFVPRSKPNDTRERIDLQTLLQANQFGPTLALGGLTAERYHDLRRAGVWGGAVLGDLFIDETPIADYLS